MRFFWKFIAIGLFLSVTPSARAMDFTELHSVTAETLCANLVLKFNGEPFFDSDWPRGSGAEVRAKLDLLKSRVAAGIETKRGLGLNLVEDQKRWDLIDGVTHLLIRIDALRPDANSHLIHVDASKAFDDLIHLWIAQRANELAVKVGLLVSESLREGAEVGESHLSRARTVLNSLTEAVGQIDRLTQGGRPTAEQNRLYADFLRAAGRAKLREFIAELKAKNIEPPTTEVLKQLLPVSLVAGADFEDVYAIWVATTQTYDGIYPSRLSDAAAVSMVRSAVRHGLSPEQVSREIRAVDSVRGRLRGYTVEGLRFAALFDLATSPGWTAESLAERFQFTERWMRAFRSSEPFDFVTVLTLLRAQDPADPDSWEDVLAEFSRLYHFGIFLPEHQKLNDIALAFLVADSTGSENLRDVYDYVDELRTAMSWDDQLPDYAPEAWVILSQFGRHYGIGAEGVADLGRRIFLLRGKKMEVGRLVTVLGLVVEKKRRSLAPDSRIEDAELAEFMSMPYLRFTLPVEDLRIDVAESSVEASNNSVTFWGSEPVRDQTPNRSGSYAIWNWDFNDGHRAPLDLASWYFDASEESFGFRIDGLRFDSVGDSVTWTPIRAARIKIKQR